MCVACCASDKTEQFILEPIRGPQIKIDIERIWSVMTGIVNVRITKRNDIWSIIIDLLKSNNVIFVLLVLTKCIHCNNEFQDIFNKRVCSTKCAVEALHGSIFNWLPFFYNSIQGNPNHCNQYGQQPQMTWRAVQEMCLEEHLLYL